MLSIRLASSPDPTRWFGMGTSSISFGADGSAAAESSACVRISYWTLEQEEKAEWLLNYRGVLLLPTFLRSEGKRISRGIDYWSDAPAEARIRATMKGKWKLSHSNKHLRWPFNTA
ncbi:MAG: hypothetical protein CM1200mP14_09060 [Gammaproteobacteria bacterium]|nr:MAG: hypothetical protein CM1200mP14_09060 [Gammaproteobacteria bacterium]